VGKKT